MNAAAQVTAVSGLGESNDRLVYRGYAVEELAERSGFEEVAHLLLHGRLPEVSELDAFKRRLRGHRELAPGLRELLERLPDDGGPLGVMDALRTGVSYLGMTEPNGDFEDPAGHAERLVARLPGMAVYRHQFAAEGRRVVTSTDAESTAGHILEMLRGAPGSAEDRAALDASLVLYADLAFNASTFACRTCASTGADLYSCLTAAVATLRGPLHGGASVAVAAFLDRFTTPGEAAEGVAGVLAGRGRVAGFGHALYRVDPRSAVLKRWAGRLSGRAGGARLVEMAEAVEAAVAAGKGLSPNVDFYTAVCYRLLGVPDSLFGPLFACARSAGWSAHVAEQRAARSIVHPSAAYVGPPPRPFVAPEERSQAD